MAIDELIDLVNSETPFLEKKSGIGDALGRAVAAFGTSNGGKVIVGVDDKSRIIGIDFNDSNRKKLTHVLDKCSINRVMIEEHDFEKGKTILCLTVDEARIKPVYFDRIPYRRENGESVQCSNEEVIFLQSETGNIKFDVLPAQTNERKALVQDISDEKLNKFIEMAKQTRNKNLNEKSTKEEILMNLGLYEKNNCVINNAAILLFGGQPQKFISFSAVSFSFFNSNEIINNFFKQTVVGTVSDLIENSINLIKRFAPPMSTIEGTKRIDISPYSDEVLRELITNAIVHRSYFIESEVNIKLFLDRIEITNPGSVPIGIDFDALVTGKNNLSVRRNNKLCEVMDFAGYMEKQGQGFPRILNTLKNKGLPMPDFPKQQGAFKAVIYAGKTATGITKSALLAYHKGKLSVLQLILESGSQGILTKDLIDKSGYTPVHMSHMLNKFEKDDHIYRKKDGRQNRIFPNYTN